MWDLYKWRNDIEAGEGGRYKKKEKTEKTKNTSDMCLFMYVQKARPGLNLLESFYWGLSIVFRCLSDFPGQGT